MSDDSNENIAIQLRHGSLSQNFSIDLEEEDKNLALQLQRQFDEDLAHAQNNDEKDKNLALQLQQQFDEDFAQAHMNDDKDINIAIQLQQQFDEDFAHTHSARKVVTTHDPEEDRNIALQLQQQFDEDFAYTQNRNQEIEVPEITHDPDEDSNIALQLQQQFDEDFAQSQGGAQSQVPITIHDPEEDKDFAMRLQQQFDEDFARTQNQVPEDTQDHVEDDDRFVRQLQDQFNNDYPPNLIEIPGLHVQLPSAEVVLLSTTEEILPSEIASEDIGGIIQGFKERLQQRYPEAKAKKIVLRTRNDQLMWTEFVAAIKEFEKTDFIVKPKISFQNEPAIDASGVFNDTIRQILETFMSLENPEYGGDGHLFIGDSTKIISNTAPIDFIDELDVFGDILFLAIIHEAPFPTDIDIVLFKHCLDLKGNITLDDLKRINVQKYNMANEILNLNPGSNLSTVIGFDEWSEERDITPVQKRMYAKTKENLEKLAKKICEDVLINSRIDQLDALKKKLNRFGLFDILKAKQVKIEQVKEYMYREIMSPNDIIQRLVFNPDLNEKQEIVKYWLIGWLREQGKDKLREFCRLTTGFTHPRNEIKITFKSTFFQENLEQKLTPKFETCSQEMKISENFPSKEALYKMMNSQVDNTTNDYSFTMV